MDQVKLQEKLEKIIEDISKDSFVYDFLAAYNIPKSTITLLKKSPNKTKKTNEVLLKNKLAFHVIEGGEDEHITIEEMQDNKDIQKFKPRFFVVTDFKTLLAVDSKTKETLDIEIKNLAKHYAFFLPWAGMEKVHHMNENPADIRAASKMAKLYDQIIKDDPGLVKKDSHDLNIFLSRLLFCFFAEDTSIFDENIFTDSIASHTQEDGSDLKSYFTDLFNTLNLEKDKRKNLPEHFNVFPYVNGGLFEKSITIPEFSFESRKIIIECGRLGWDAINPDIFGSMIQAVVHPGLRENLGMHYTSVSNILKVIEPLFLNNLREEFNKNKDKPKKLEELRERIATIKIFDPACGSGNFLIISYKELCKLELKIIEKLKELGKDTLPVSGVSLNNFYGIEIDDFAHKIARLSLWLAQHQMNVFFDDVLGMLKPTLPLKESGNIVYGNATRLDWEKICPKKDYKGDKFEIYLIGNPPFGGSRKQKDDQKSDIEFVFKDKFRIYKSLDYVSIWYFKLADYVRDYKTISGALVSTNSIVQGEQVSLFWPKVLEKGIEIIFAHTSFKWKNLAKNNAGVSCVIIGLAGSRVVKDKYIFKDDTYIKTDNITPYLTPGDTIFVSSAREPISMIPEMSFGNMPADGGQLIFTPEEKDLFLEKEPDSEKYFRRLISAHEFINGQQRWCLWFKDEDIQELNKMPFIKNRIDNVRKIRTDSSRPQLSEIPHLFAQITQKEDQDFILIPRHSSERREYLPIGFFSKDYVSHDSCLIVSTDETYIFGIITSRMHMVWLRAVGGKLKTDYRYSKNIVYNTFPFPDITDNQKKTIAKQVYNILDERERHPEKTMSELYDLEKMPESLRDAHRYLDEVIEGIYRKKPFNDDIERLEYLFTLYEEMVKKDK